MIKFILIFIFTVNFAYGYEKYTDDNNLYFESDHFKVIFGKSYLNSSSTESLATNYLNILEEVWSYEIDYLGFQAPKNSLNNKIDVYIGNKSAYNIKQDYFITISSNEAGYATFYNDYTPYFVINPEISTNLVSVTIAHEFFHMIQYSYFDYERSSSRWNDGYDDDGEVWWNNSIWWLEATATLLEDEVYDNNNDYIGAFLNKFFTNTVSDIETYNSSLEYSRVIIAKYFKEKYGIEFIKKTFEYMESYNTAGMYETLDLILKDFYESSIEKELREFSIWILNKDKYFEEGNLYPDVVSYDQDDLKTIKKGGIKIIANVQKGWNMVALPTIKLSLFDINGIESIWSYQYSNWQNSLTQDKFTDITDLNISQGYWIQADKNLSIPYTYYDISLLNLEKLKDGWNLVTTSELLEPDMKEEVLIWQYKDQKWYIYTNDSNIQNKAESLGYEKLTKILPYSSYWIFK